MNIRQATKHDVPQMVALSDEKRSAYESDQPVFWRKARNASEIQAPYFESLLTKEQHFVLISEADGIIHGFLIGAVVSAPPVYDPGGETCVIDDFCISSSASWENEGTDLLDESRKYAHELGAIQLVVVCGHKDELKRDMLQKTDLSIASEWYTGPI